MQDFVGKEKVRCRLWNNTYLTLSTLSVLLGEMKTTLHHRADHLTQSGAKFSGVSETMSAYQPHPLSSGRVATPDTTTVTGSGPSVRPPLPFHGVSSTQAAYADTSRSSVPPAAGVPIQKLHGRPTVDDSTVFRGVSSTQAALAAHLVAGEEGAVGAGAIGTDPSGVVGEGEGYGRPQWAFEGRSTTQEALLRVRAAVDAGDSGVVEGAVRETSLHHEEDHLSDPNARFAGVSAYQSTFRPFQEEVYAPQPEPDVDVVRIARPFRGVSTTHFAQAQAQYEAQAHPLPDLPPW